MVPAKVPQDVENLVIVLNGREDSKVEFSTVWLNYLTSSLPRLVNLAVVMLGNEMCDNRYVKQFFDASPTFIVMWNQRAELSQSETRMHSSRMRTDRCSGHH